jgi:hypothetical protein
MRRGIFLFRFRPRMTPEHAAPAAPTSLSHGMRNACRPAHGSKRRLSIREDADVALRRGTASESGRASTSLRRSARRRLRRRLRRRQRCLGDRCQRPALPGYTSDVNRVPTTPYGDGLGRPSGRALISVYRPDRLTRPRRADTLPRSRSGASSTRGSRSWWTEPRPRGVTSVDGIHPFRAVAAAVGQVISGRGLDGGVAAHRPVN